MPRPLPDAPPTTDPNEPYWFLYGDYRDAVTRDVNLSAHSKSLYLRTARQFGRWCEAEAAALDLTLPLDPAAITARHCAQWQAAQAARYALSSVAVWRVAVGLWFAWLARQREIPASPWATLPHPRPVVHAPPTLTLTEIRALLATCGPRETFVDRRDYAVLYVLVDCGLRRAELLDLQVVDVQLDEGYVRVRHGKGGKSRDVGLGTNALAAIRAYLRSRRRQPGADLPWLWLSTRPTPHTGERMAKVTLYSLLQRRCALAGIEREVYPHLFRHTAISLMLGQEGVQEGNVIAEAGWAERTSREMLERYGRADRQKRAIRAHHAHAPGDLL